MKVILASQSPRRKELLDEMGIEYEVVPSQFEEKLDTARPAEDGARERELHPHLVARCGKLASNIRGQYL